MTTTTTEAEVETTTSEDDELSLDNAWLVSTQVALSYLIDDVQTIGEAANDLDFDDMAEGYSTFRAQYGPHNRLMQTMKSRRV